MAQKSTLHRERPICRCREFDHLSCIAQSVCSLLTAPSCDVSTACLFIRGWRVMTNQGISSRAVLEPELKKWILIACLDIIIIIIIIIIIDIRFLSPSKHNLFHNVILNSTTCATCFNPSLRSSSCQHSRI
jgi:hypothetical protein